MSSQVQASAPVQIFDGKLVRRHRERAARMAKGGHPLFAALAEEMADRLLGIRHDFPTVLQLGGLGASVASKLAGQISRQEVLCDSVALVSHSGDDRGLHVVADDMALPFADSRFDLVISMLGLHWIDDVQRHLAAIKRLLRPGGLFMAALAGGETFASFRSCFMETELALRGGAGSRFSPMIDMASVSKLMLQAGFRFPVADRELCNLTYRDVFSFAHDLRGLGATAAHHARAREWLPRSAFVEAEKLYRSRQGGETGRLAVQAELFFLHGWQDD